MDNEVKNIYFKKVVSINDMANFLYLSHCFSNEMPIGYIQCEYQFFKLKYNCNPISFTYLMTNYEQFKWIMNTVLNQSRTFGTKSYKHFFSYDSLVFNNEIRIKFGLTHEKLKSYYKLLIDLTTKYVADSVAIKMIRYHYFQYIYETFEWLNFDPNLLDYINFTIYEFYNKHLKIFFNDHKGSNVQIKNILHALESAPCKIDNFTINILIEKCKLNHSVEKFKIKMFNLELIVNLFKFKKIDIDINYLKSVYNENLSYLQLSDIKNGLEGLEDIKAWEEIFI